MRGGIILLQKCNSDCFLSLARMSGQVAVEGVLFVWDGDPREWEETKLES
jgi:hypothetical protein